jgi:putative RNA 2'-phosphotransferase
MSTPDAALSKWMSWALRHDPTAAGIVLDAAGWVAVRDLLTAAAREGHVAQLADLQRVVASSDKKRFALSADGSRIRANQGHSVAVDLGLMPLQPPELLFHGTADRFLPSIRQSGLIKGARQHVHLSADTQTAQAVGSRHGKAIILTVTAGQMAREGYPFYRSENGVWLTDSVPLKYLVIDGYAIS